HCVRLDKSALEIHLIEDTIRELVLELITCDVWLQFDAIATVVPTSECQPDSFRQAVISRLKDNGIPLIFLDFNPFTSVPERIDGFTQEETSCNWRESVDMEIGIAYKAA